MDAPADWTYPPTPGRDAAGLARGEFFPRLFRPPAHVLFRILLRLLFRYRVHNRRAIPRKGPFILVANHSGHADAPALMAAIPLRRVNTTHPLAAADYFFRGRALGALVHFSLNALPIDRSVHADEALADGRTLLADGRGLILFPEGTRSTTGEIGPFKKGVGMLSAGTSIQVIPVYIEGSRNILPKGAKMPHFRRLRVILGTPIRYTNVAAAKEGWVQVAADLERRVRDLGDMP